MNQVVDGDRGEDFGAAAPKVCLSTAPNPSRLPLPWGQVGQPASLQATQRQGRGARESAAAVPRRHDARRLARLTAAAGGGVVVVDAELEVRLRFPRRIAESESVTQPATAAISLGTGRSRRTAGAEFPRNAGSAG